MPLPTSISNSTTGETTQSVDSTLRQTSSTLVNDAGQATGSNSGSSAAQSTKSEVEKAADKLYEERIEDEYAKREGGA